MTNEQALKELKMMLEYDNSLSPNLYKAVEMATQALEQQPCEDVISRQAVIAGLVNIAKAKAKSSAQKAMMGRSMFFVERLPSVTPTPKMGRWIHIFMENGDDYFEAWDIAGVHTFAAQYRCDKCGFVHTVIEDFGRYSYCPNCGAKMEV